jgi:hypothetical protein
MTEYWILFGLVVLVAGVVILKGDITIKYLISSKRTLDTINLFNLIYIQMMLKRFGVEKITSEESMEIISEIEKSTIPEIALYAKFFKESSKEIIDFNEKLK